MNFFVCANVSIVILLIGCQAMKSNDVTKDEFLDLYYRDRKVSDHIDYKGRMYGYYYLEHYKIMGGESIVRHYTTYRINSKDMPANFPEKPQNKILEQDAGDISIR